MRFYIYGMCFPITTEIFTLNANLTWVENAKICNRAIDKTKYVWNKTTVTLC